MALSALQALGASADRLSEFHALYGARLTRRIVPPIAPALTDDEWVRSLGRFDQFEALLQYTEAAVRRQGRSQALRRLLPALMPGVAAAAFHGLIRTAHGMAATHDQEVAMGLAYWSSRYQTLGQADAVPVASATLAEWLTRLRALQAGRDLTGRLITARMKAWSEVPGFSSIAASLCLSTGTLCALARLAASIYAASGGFIALHLVTACQALHVLEPELDQTPSAMRDFTRAAAAALLASNVLGMPDLSGVASQPKTEWATIVSRAIRSNDEHVIKLVHACLYFHERLQEEVFEFAAMRAVPAPV